MFVPTCIVLDVPESMACSRMIVVYPIRNKEYTYNILSIQVRCIFPYIRMDTIRNTQGIRLTREKTSYQQMLGKKPLSGSLLLAPKANGKNNNTRMIEGRINQNHQTYQEPFYLSFNPVHVDMLRFN